MIPPISVLNTVLFKGDYDLENKCPIPTIRTMCRRGVGRFVENVLEMGGDGEDSVLKVGDENPRRFLLKRREGMGKVVDNF